jgi:16S rRNA (uracil1498-N3)-methyltransferase
MHIPRFFLMPEDVRPLRYTANGSLDLHAGDKCEIVNPAVVSQIKNVLRLAEGDRVQLLNGSGLLWNCRLGPMAGKVLSFRVEDQVELPIPPLHITVALAVLKGERFDWALQKLSELGVSTIVPLLTSRTVVKLNPVDAKGTSTKLPRWQAIAREAAEQSERATVPHIVAPRSFQDHVIAITTGGTTDNMFICAERIDTESLKDILLASNSKKTFSSGTADTTIELIVGPEGGFTDEEIDFACKQGVKPVSLGPRIMRSETAAIYALLEVIWCLEK